MSRALPLVVALLALPAGAAAGAEPEDLFAAARGGRLEEVRRAVEAGVPVDAADRYGTTALAMAARSGHVEVARWLLDRGADPDRDDDFYGFGPLDLALFYGHPETASLLLARGADDREGALEFALRAGDPELARAAVTAGPLRESRLAAMRSRVGELDPVFREILAAARSRPDPAPPVLSAAERERFVGLFEGWTSDTTVEVELRGESLWMRVDGGQAWELEATGAQAFRTVDGEAEAEFFGRAGGIEGLQLRGADGSPESLRRSVAEPVAGAAAGLPAPVPGPPPEPSRHWPGFRGANADGIGDGVDTPVTWDLGSGENVLWRAELPGLGNSSPVVWGERVFVTTAVAAEGEQKIRTGLTGAGTGVDEAVEHRWLVLAFDKRSGRRLWESEIGRGIPLTRRHFKATQANSTPVTDGRHLVAVFPTAGLACLDVDGRVLWKEHLGGLNAGAFSDPGMEWGFASSPVIHGTRVILQVDVHDGPYLAAWDLESGRQLWRSERDVAPSWATPALVRGPEGDELVTNASTIRGYDPESGRELWTLAPNSELVIATPVAGDGVVYVSAGYPPVKPIYALRAGARGALRVEPGAAHDGLVWSHGRGGAYMPTPLLYRGLLYVVHHNGRLVAYDAASGTPVLKSRFSRGGTFTGSPVAVNGKLYIGTEEGLLYVLEAGPEYRELAVNDLAEPLMATPAVSEGILLLRTPTRLIAVASSPPPPDPVAPQVPEGH